MSAKKPTRSERNIAWIEKYCIVPDGAFIGQPVKLLDFQKQIIHGVYDSPTRLAIASMAKKGGKTTFVGCVLLLHLCGPEARANSQLYSSAQTRDQASVIFELCAKMVRFSPVLSNYVHIRDTNKEIICPKLGTKYAALSADAKARHGKSPVFVVHDELGQVSGPRSESFSALENAMGAHIDPLSIVISTQAATDGDLLSILIDDAKKGLDPKTKVWLWETPKEDDPFPYLNEVITLQSEMADKREQKIHYDNNEYTAKINHLLSIVETMIKKSNPAFGITPTRDETLTKALSTARMPSQENNFRNFNLNQRVEAESPAIAKTTWDANAGKPADDFTKTPVYCGLDLSETQDLTAFLMTTFIDGAWHVKPIFWLPKTGLAEKSSKDRVPWDKWNKEGYLETTPGKAIKYEFVATRLLEIFKTHDIKSVAFDRHRMEFLKPWLEKVGFDETMMSKFEDFGQGFVSMGGAVHELETILLSNEMRHGNHPILTMCAANARVEVDPAGNKKYSKKTSRGRIDGLVALAMAISVATKQKKSEPEKFTSIYDDPTWLANFRKS